MRQILYLVLALLCVSFLAACGSREKEHAPTYEYMEERAGDRSSTSDKDECIDITDVREISKDDFLCLPEEERALMLAKVNSAIEARKNSESGSSYIYLDGNRRIDLMAISTEMIERIRAILELTEIQQTVLPKSDIMFLNIPWGTPEKDAIRTVQEHFSEINDEIIDTPVSSHSFSDPKEEYIDRISSDSVVTKTVKLSKAGNSGISIPFGDVAGYKVNSIYLYFVKDSSDYYLYSAAYCFAENATMPPMMQFADLQNKMTNLYGDPKTYEYEENVTSFASSNLCCVWLGSDSSAAYLNYGLYTSGMFAGGEDVWLYYGIADLNNIFSDSNRNSEEESRQVINSILADNSGL